MALNPKRRGPMSLPSKSNHCHGSSKLLPKLHSKTQDDAENRSRLPENVPDQSPLTPSQSLPFSSKTAQFACSAFDHARSESDGQLNFNYLSSQASFIFWWIMQQNCWERIFLLVGGLCIFEDGNLFFAPDTLMRVRHCAFYFKALSQSLSDCDCWMEWMMI